MTYPTNDLRQRFFIKNSPVRGDVVRLKHSFAQIIAQKDYPFALQKLLGEMLVATSLLISTLKIHGRLSLQLQNNHITTNDEQPYLKWAMAECNHQGNIRALADWQGNWQSLTTANQAFATLGKMGDGVLFINIQPEAGQDYQGIVERVADNLADCLAHYQQQSVQIPTLINLACDGLQAGGILVQLLPRNSEDEQLYVDEDLFPRLTMLTKTLKSTELTNLPPHEILYRLYHEEDIVIPEATYLQFACTCSQEKSESAIFQLGEQQALEIANEQNGKISLDCGFCGRIYHFNPQQIQQIFQS